jgi:hypothetical protein
MSVTVPRERAAVKASHGKGRWAQAAFVCSKVGVSTYLRSAATA